MKTAEQLINEGWENTGMHIFGKEVWQNTTTRLVYDQDEQHILFTYVREFKYQEGLGGSLSVGERSHK